MKICATSVTVSSLAVAEPSNVLLVSRDQPALRHFSVFSFVLTMALSISCQHIGHNDSFLLQNKKDLRAFYAVEEIENDPDEKTRRINNKLGREVFDIKERDKVWNRVKEELREQRRVSLQEIYTTNTPFSLTDVYDVRTVRRPIRVGDPLNIVINKVHIDNNGEVLCFTHLCLDKAEIAVVVTVDDGKGEEPRQVMVDYEHAVAKDVDLPLADLLVYSTDFYGGETIRIEVSVLDLEEAENQTSEEILGTAAKIGSALTPAFAPALSIAAQVGKHLIDANRDSIIAKFTFQLYPWGPGFRGRTSDHFGVPRISQGQYIVLRSDSAVDIQDLRLIHIDWDLNVYKIEDQHIEDIDKIKVERMEGDKEKLRPWPMDPLAEKDFRWPGKKNLLHLNHLMLTVDHTPILGAGSIIDRMDKVNRALVDLSRGKENSVKKTEILKEELDGLKSSIERLQGQNVFYQRKADPHALEVLFGLHEKLQAENDRAAVLELIRIHLPEAPVAFVQKHNALRGKAADAPSLYKKWYHKIVPCLHYDPVEGKYVVRDENRAKCYE